MMETSNFKIYDGESIQVMMCGLFAIENMPQRQVIYVSEQSATSFNE